MEFGAALYYMYEALGFYVNGKKRLQVIIISTAIPYQNELPL